jgi:hypothetical protein
MGKLLNLLFMLTPTFLPWPILFSPWLFFLAYALPSITPLFILTVAN